MLVGDVERDGAVAVRLDVAEITDVSLSGVGSAVLGSGGLYEVRSVRGGSVSRELPQYWRSRTRDTHVEVGSSRCASVAVVTELHEMSERGVTGKGVSYRSTGIGQPVRRTDPASGSSVTAYS